MSLDNEQLSKLWAELSGYDAIIIPCSSKKQESMKKGRADELYCGGFFKKQLALATKLNDKVLIFSTKYGILERDSIIEPYNLMWSKALKMDNRRLRKLDIPVATESQRLAHSAIAVYLLKDKRVLSFCSLHYRPYIPDFDYFNDIAGKYAPDSTRKGIQFLNKTMHQLIEVTNGTF